MVSAFAGLIRPLCNAWARDDYLLALLWLLNEQQRYPSRLSCAEPIPAHRAAMPE
jgi:hypothetical protein